MDLLWEVFQINVLNNNQDEKHDGIISIIIKTYSKEDKGFTTGGETVALKEDDVALSFSLPT